MPDRERYDPHAFRTRRLTDRFMQIKHARGTGIVSYDPEQGALTVELMRVDSRYAEAGVDRNMLRYSHRLARQLGATSVDAPITSREELDAATTVFGEDAVTVHSIGAYASPTAGKSVPRYALTSATLHYPLEPAEPTNGTS